LAYEVLLAADSRALPDKILGDAVRLRQVLLNLVDNAVKFQKSDSMTTSNILVQLSATESADGGYEFKITISDTGVGMSPEQLSRLFQAFSQTDNSSTRLHGGTGLGLVICKRIVEAMGGRIWAENLVEQQGTLFAFTFVANATGPIPATPPVPDLLLGCRVLLVEDNLMLRHTVAQVLQQHDLSQLEETASSLQALEWLRESRHYDLAIID
jgi:CheY-like chemotaxis protein